MAKYIKGNISFTPVVEQINRKFCIKAKTCAAPVKIGPVETQSNYWMGAATRVTGRGHIGRVSKNYLIFRENARQTPVLTDEIQRRVLFATAAAGRNHILHDLSQLTRVQTMFNQADADMTKTVNGVSAYGYTLNGWVMAVQYAGKKESSSYDVNTFPQGFDA